MMPMPQPRDLPVIREDAEFIVINDGISKLAIRKPLQEGRWNERRGPDGTLLSLQLKIKGVC